MFSFNQVVLDLVEITVKCKWDVLSSLMYGDNVVTIYM